MRYFIFENNQTREVQDIAYEIWHKESASRYMLPDYEIVTEDFIYSVETMYQGAIDKGEAVLPFILICFEDELKIYPDKVKQEPHEEKIEYYATFEELKKAYEKLKKELEGKRK